MKKFFETADRYIRESDWKVIAALKLCLLSLGICMGLSLPRGKKKLIFPIAAAVFTVTWTPLTARYVRLVCGQGQAKKELKPPVT